MNTVSAKLMSVDIDQSSLYEGLKLVSGVIESSQVMQILSFVHMHIESNKIILSASNAEVEIQTTVNLIKPVQEALAITVPCRKLMDILRYANKSSPVVFEIEGAKLHVSIDRSRFTVNMLAADQFPFFVSKGDAGKIEISESELSILLKRTAFAMAFQDVRYFLNGLLMEFNGAELKAVATDGHRLSVNAIDLPASQLEHFRVIIPRKTILEVTRLIGSTDQMLGLSVNTDFIEIEHPKFRLRSNLIDAQYPDYQKLVPKVSDDQALLDTASFRLALNRVNILANEKFRGVRLNFTDDNELIFESNNLDKEVATETIKVLEAPAATSIAFNIAYLSDVLSVIESEKVLMKLSGMETGTVIQEDGAMINSLFVVMPLTL